MSHPGRPRHRDRAETRREPVIDEPLSPHRVFRITQAQRQELLSYLRLVDEARLALERQQNRLNRDIVRDLRAAADNIFDVLSELEETDD